VGAVPVEVGLVLRGEVGVADHQQVLRVALLRRSAEVEAPGDDGVDVDQDYLVVGDGVL
jgi:hypothetical protein